MYRLNNKDLMLLAGAALLLLPALLINLGLVPLYLEEPRRAAVALEMLLRGNGIVPTINGDPYYLKPPLFSWIIAGMYSISGNYSEFITRVPTVISFLLLGLVIFLTGKKYVSLSFGALSSMLFLTAAGNLFFNALLAEIDIFYSLVTYAGLLCLFHFHQQKRYLLLFLTVYLSGAIGFLTKGMPSLVYTGLSLLVYFIINKEFRVLLGWKHFAGIFLFIALVGGYFLIYNKEGDVVEYLRHLTYESGKRVTGETFAGYLRHITLYPLDTLMNLLPASLLLVFVFRRSFLDEIRRNQLMKFALLMLIIHFPVYWLPPGGRQRYIIMLYPFIIQIMVYFFLIHAKSGKKINRIRPVIVILYLMVAFRLVFNFVVLPVRAEEGNTPDNKSVALEIAGMVHGKEVCILTGSYFPMQSTFYLEKERMQILPYCSEVMPGVYHIVAQHLLEPWQVRRDIGAKHRHPTKPLSDPFTGDDQAILSGFIIKEKHSLIIQKHLYQLIMPLHQDP